MEMDQYRQGKMVKLVCEGCRLGDKGQLESMILSTCKLLGMTYLSGPFYGDVTGEGDNDGTSAILIIKESHIALHSWPKRNALRVVVDSCKDFSLFELVSFFFEYLKPRNIIIYEEKISDCIEAEDFYFNKLLLDDTLDSC